MSAPAEFRRELGLLDATVVVIGGIIGVGIFANPSNVARILDSPLLILGAWCLGGVVTILGGYIWAELGSRFPYVGGQYVYLTRNYPPIIGFLYGFALLFIINGGSLAAVAIIFGSYVDRAFVPLGPAGIRLAAASALVVFTAINSLGVKAGTRTNNALMAVKIGGMLVLAALIFSSPAPWASHFTVELPRNGYVLPLLLTALVPIMFAYGGWQNCGTLAAEIKNPARTLAWANILGVNIVIVLYVMLNLAYLRALPPDAIAHSSALAADAARAMVGEAGGRFVSALIVISCLGYLAAMTLTGPRLYYAMARDGVFFERAAHLHPRYGTPVFALWFQATVSLVLLTTNTYDELLSFVVFADWLFFMFTAGAIFIVRRRGETGPDVVTVPGHPFTTGAFVLVAIGMVVNSFFAYPTQSLVGSAILVFGAVVYALIPTSRRVRP